MFNPFSPPFTLFLFIALQYYFPSTIISRKGAQKMAEDIIRNENAVYQKYSTLIISPENIAHNVDVIRSITDRTPIAVVKEKGYGMGLWNEYQILKDLDIHFYAVTNCEVALALRRFGCQEKILIMSPVLEYPYCLELARQDITFSLESPAQAELLEQVYALK